MISALSLSAAACSAARSSTARKALCDPRLPDRPARPDRLNGKFLKYLWLGFRKDFINPNTIEALSRILKVVSAAQTVAGIVLLFCFGLAVRNRFRMK